MKTKNAHRLHRLTQRGWHPQPIIAAGIRTCWRKNPGMKTRFCNREIQIKPLKKISVISVICGLIKVKENKNETKKIENQAQRSNRGY
jgi:hypothetical protein